MSGVNIDIKRDSRAVKVGDAENKLARFVGRGVKIRERVAAAGDDVQPVGIYPYAGEDVTGSVFYVGGVDDRSKVVLYGIAEVIALYDKRAVFECERVGYCKPPLFWGRTL